MSNNPNFYSNFPPHFTFQRPRFVPPPPPPPSYFMPSVRPPQMSDQEFVKQFDYLPTTPLKHKVQPNLSINEVKEQLRRLVLNLNEIKEKECFLKNNINEICEDEFEKAMNDIEKSKAEINGSLALINDTYLENLRKLLAKRSAKRLRLKRLREEKKKEKEIRIKQLEERSRKIDENLQKIKDDINKSKQDEEAKLQADIVLKETLCKKHDAKKCVAKLCALLKLYKARQNTAKGRGEPIAERDAEAFTGNIEKLKSLWIQKLHQYEKEELELRATLEQDDAAQSAASKRDAEVLDNLRKWQEFLFGGKELPQRDFHGDTARFVGVRCQWDQYISPEGTAIPVGWVLPNLKDN